MIFSDGWERGDPILLAEQMAQLRRLAHTVLWVNPHAGAGGYQPVQSGIAAACRSPIVCSPDTAWRRCRNCSKRCTVRDD